MVEDPAQWPIFLSAGIALLGTLLYLAVHFSGLVRIGMSSDREPIHTMAIAAWSISFVGGFMGPCVAPVNLVSLLLGGLSLRGEPSERTRICAQTAIAAGLIIQLMIVGMVAALVPFIMATNG